jgi:hypothetical protein
MTTQTFGVYSPTTGETIIAATKDEAIAIFTKLALDFVRPYFHNTMYLTINTNDDGSVSYFNDGNEVDRFLSPAETEAEWANLNAETPPLV